MENSVDITVKHQNRSINSCKKEQLTMENNFRSRSKDFQSKYKLVTSRLLLNNLKQPSSIKERNCEDTDSKDVRVNRHRWIKSCPTDISMNVQRNIGTSHVMAGKEGVFRSATVTSLEMVKHHWRKSDIYNSVRTSETKYTNKIKHNVSRLSEHSCYKINNVEECERLDLKHYSHGLENFNSVHSSSTKLNSFMNPSQAWIQLPTVKKTDVMSRRSIKRYPNKDVSLVNIKYPDGQDSFRYIIMPSWPSYEDIQKLNNCHDHTDLMTRLYGKCVTAHVYTKADDYMTKYCTQDVDRLRFHDNQAHILPWYIHKECLMCNLYTSNDDIIPCPPNTPLVQ